MRRFVSPLAVVGLALATACKPSGGGVEATRDAAAVSTPGPGDAAQMLSATMLVDAGPSMRAVSIASFIKDDLDECVDFTFPNGSIDLRARIKTLQDGGVLLTATCSETFSDRPVLGTCSVASMIDGSTASVTLVARYFRFETVVDSDVWLKQCLQMSGKWQALARDSDEFKRAEHARRVKSLNKLTDKAQQ